ncbi:hypothetical protein PV408_48055, partial [Streptomyces sp. ME18-1-4]|nr:hypothetical protein [Streptomyces sp. ME18-1-4]
QEAARPAGLAPLPRRVPQTSLATELREDSAAAAAASVEEDGFPDDFTAERAASSLAGFQRGTLRAQADTDTDTEADSSSGPDSSSSSSSGPGFDAPLSGLQETSAEEAAPGPPVAAGTAQTPTPPTDRS